jgi:CBS domain-containing protein
MRLDQLMTTQVRSCPPGAPLSEAAKIMAEANCGAVPVVSGERIVGMLTDRDIVIRTVAKGKNPLEATCGDCMTQPITTASPDMDAHAAASLMADKQIRRLPVVENDRLVGIVALGDLATEAIHVDEAGEALSDISVPSRPGTH